MRAQDLTAARKLMMEGRLAQARSAIDKLIAGPEAQKPEAWVLKGQIYQALANNDASRNQVPDARQQAVQALIRAYEMPGGTESLARSLGANYIQVFYDHYQRFIDESANRMKEGQFREALARLEGALQIGEFYVTHQLRPASLDTSVVFYAGYAALQAGAEEKALLYFTRLTSARASGTDLEIAYGWLSNYLLETRQDRAAARRVCELGLSLYPQDEYLRRVELTLARAGNQPEDLFMLLEKRIQEKRATVRDYLLYGSELYDYLYTGSKKISGDLSSRRQRLEELMNEVLRLSPASAQAWLILGLQSTGLALEAQQKNKAAASDAEKTRWTEQAQASADQAIERLEKAVQQYEKTAGLSATDKEYRKTALQQLVNLYLFRQKNPEARRTEEKLGLH